MISLEKHGRFIKLLVALAMVKAEPDRKLSSILKEVGYCHKIYVNPGKFWFRKTTQEALQLPIFKGLTPNYRTWTNRNQDNNNE